MEIILQHCILTSSAVSAWRMRSRRAQRTPWRWRWKCRPRGLSSLPDSSAVVCHPSLASPISIRSPASTVEDEKKHTSFTQFNSYSMVVLVTCNWSGVSESMSCLCELWSGFVRTCDSGFQYWPVRQGNSHEISTFASRNWTTFANCPKTTVRTSVVTLSRNCGLVVLVVVCLSKGGNVRISLKNSDQNSFYWFTSAKMDINFEALLRNELGAGIGLGCPGSSEV